MVRDRVLPYATYTACEIMSPWLQAPYAGRPINSSAPGQHRYSVVPGQLIVHKHFHLDTQSVEPT